MILNNNITLPAILFGLVVAGLVGSTFHLIRGGSGRALLFSLFLSILGFIAGQGAGIYFGVRVFAFGFLDIGMGVIGSMVFLGGVDAFGRLRNRNKTSV